MNLRFDVEGRLDGHTNMARDSRLLERAEDGEPGCRVYGWTGPWVSLGRFQNPERDLVDPEHTNWVIRPTGGKAVLHGHDVTVGLAVPLSMLDVTGRQLKPVYRAVVLPIVEAMRACGVAAILGEKRVAGPSIAAARQTADCFAIASANDVVDEMTGLKVCGCALRLTDSAVLVQASLPNGRPLVRPEETIRNAALSTREWDPKNFAPALEAALRSLLLARV